MLTVTQERDRDSGLMIGLLAVFAERKNSRGRDIFVFPFSINLPFPFP